MRPRIAVLDPAEDNLPEQLLISGSYTVRNPHGGRFRRLLGRLRDRGRPVRPGVHLLGFNDATGRVRRLASLGSVRNASWLAVHPSGKALYAVSETAKGLICGVSLDAGSAALRLLECSPSGGEAPCFVTTDRSGTHLYVANYGSGSVSVHPIHHDGPAASIQAITHGGSGPVAGRQARAHPHAVVLAPDGRFALVPDLGADRIVVYRVDAASGRLIRHVPSAVHTRPGAGPRHLAFHPAEPLVFVVNELDCTVASYQWDSASGVLQRRDVVSTLPPRCGTASTAAHLQVHPGGRFLYASNRGYDSVSTLALNAEGDLSYVATVATGGRTPRGFTLSPCGRFLLAAHQDSEIITSFKVDDSTGRLEVICRSAAPAAVCLAFLPER